MKKNILLVLLVLLPLATLGQARRAHLFKIIDSENAHHILREASKTIEATIDHEFGLLVDELDMKELTPVVYDVSEHNFNFAQLKNAIDNAVIRSNDVVLVVYVGHGERTEYNPTYYPEFDMKADAYDNRAVHVNYFETVVEKILKDSPAVMLNLVIACQTSRSIELIHDKVMNKNESDLIALAPDYTQREQARYAYMFRKEPDRTLVVDFISADKGLPTFIDVTGGIFFNQFITAFHTQLLPNSPASWGDMAVEIQQKTQIKFAIEYNDLASMGVKQVPFCHVSYNLAGTDHKPNRSKFVEFITGSTTAEKELRADLKDLHRKHKQELHALEDKQKSEMRQAKNQGKGKAERNSLKHQHKREKQNLIAQQRRERDWLRS